MMWAEVKTPTLSLTELSACMVSEALGAVVQLFTSMGSMQLPKHIMAFEMCCRGSGISSWTGRCCTGCRRPVPRPSGQAAGS